MQSMNEERKSSIRDNAKRGTVYNFLKKFKMVTFILIYQFFTSLKEWKLVININLANIFQNIFFEV